jgi:hypothetical protein
MLTITTIAMGKTRIWTTAAIVAVVQIVAAQAQPTKKVMVVMDEPCSSSAPKAIIVVLTVGSETVRVPVVRKTVDEPWEGERLDGKTFPADRAIASLRLKDGRTECESSVAWKNTDRKDVAKFTFHCDEQPIRSLEIRADGPIKISYQRRSKFCPKEREHEVLKAASRAYSGIALWVPGEELRLRLGWDEPDPSEPGLLVFSLNPAKDLPIFWTDTKNPRLLVFDSGGKRHKERVVEALPIERKDIVQALVRQRGTINGDTSPNASKNDDERLKGVGLNTLTLTVK